VTFQASEHVLPLEECTDDRLALVGGKATSLGNMLRQGLQVPPGFAVTTAAYREHVAHNAMATDLERLVADCTTYEAQMRASEQIRELFERSTPAPAVEDEIRRAYEVLCDDPTMPVAVRSSATAEDMANASFAGQQETYLWIMGADEVLRHVLRCWSSLFTPQAIAYRARLRTDVTDLAMGVVVQRMVPAEAAGVMLTIDPISGDRSSIVIEAAYGLGAAVVNGEVEPDRFCVDKLSMQIRTRSTGVKSVAYRFDPSAQGTTLAEVPSSEREKPCVSDEEMLELAQLGVRMEQAMGKTQDIEWAIGPDRQIYMLQARPETVWSQRHVASTPS
jgi:phosphoenolpyruvate synthase/pyruvate phosphate dikinase